MSYSIIGIDSFDYVLLFKIHRKILRSTKIHFDSISESSWDNLDYRICPLCQEGMFARFHIERGTLENILYLFHFTPIEKIEKKV